MKFTLQLCIEDDASDTITEQVYCLDKEHDSFECIGMNLLESKEILKNIQKILVEKQLSAYLQERNLQKYRKKGYYQIKLKTLFGDVSFKSPRYYTERGENNKTFTPLNELLPRHITPELLYLETKWAALIPFEKTSALLKEVLPVAQTINATTIQNHLNNFVSEQESKIGEEQFMYNSGSISYRESLPRPERTMIIGMDGGYIRDWNNKKNVFEVIVGKTVPWEKSAKCFGFVGTYDKKPKRRIYEHLKYQGMLPHQKLELFCDGAQNLRNMQIYLNAESVQILDWFHITMRITVLNQFALGLLKVDVKTGQLLLKILKSIKWNLWHGKAEDALDLIEDLEVELDGYQNNTSPKKKYENLKKLIFHINDFYTYINNNGRYVVNYSERYRYGETITTSFVESTVNYVIAKRFNKKQSMQWTKRGAHLLLQARTQVLNEDWESVFRKIYPKFRPMEIIENKVAA